MTQKRLFTFGCSYTSYYTLTWADIMARVMEPEGYEFYNLGCAGSGNVSIFHTMMRAHEKYNITSDDMVMVMFTSWAREDRWWPETGLQPRGGVMFNPCYPADFVEQYWSMENDVIQNYTSINACRKLFDISFEGFMGTSDVPQHDDKMIRYCQTVKRAHKNPFLSHSDLRLNRTLSPLTHIQYRTLMGTTGHPLPHHHLMYVMDCIAPQVSLEVSQDVVDWVRDVESMYGAACGTTSEQCQKYLGSIRPTHESYFWELWNLDDIFDWPQPD